MDSSVDSGRDQVLRGALLEIDSYSEQQKHLSRELREISGLIRTLKNTMAEHDELVTDRSGLTPKENRVSRKPEPSLHDHDPSWKVFPSYPYSLVLLLMPIFHHFIGF